MTRLIFIRHGETDLAGTFCGQSDPPLNRAGRTQAGELLTALAQENFSVVYSSGLQRASQTADVLARAYGVPQVALPGLREIDFGAWEGLRWAEIEALDPAYAARWIAEYPRLSAPGGETFSSFRERVLAAVDTLKADTRWACGAVVTHAGVMRVVLEDRCGRTSAEAWEMTRGYCSHFVYPAEAPR